MEERKKELNVMTIPLLVVAEIIQGQDRAATLEHFSRR